MTNEGHRIALNTIEERKKLLIAEGALYRIEIRNCREIISSQLHVGTIANNIIGRLVSIIGATFSKHTLLHTGNLRTVLPLVLGSISTLSKNSRLRLLFRTVLIGSMVTAAISYAIKKKKLH